MPSSFELKLGARGDAAAPEGCLVLQAFLGKSWRLSYHLTASRIKKDPNAIKLMRNGNRSPLWALETCPASPTEVFQASTTTTEHYSRCWIRKAFFPTELLLPECNAIIKDSYWNVMAALNSPCFIPICKEEEWSSSFYLKLMYFLEPTCFTGFRRAGKTIFCCSNTDASLWMFGQNMLQHF